ncbi:hypothetical protein [Sorangium sp. So ce861]|uniref:hypothetical protein n=1 Tax=Sorangium sp. So ce861 TaxID=3133323 RepID=UPI003F60D53C
MIRYRLVLNAPSSKSERERTVTVSIPARHGDEVAELAWSGLDWAVDHARHILESQYGTQPRAIGARTTPRNLAAAMESPQMKAFRPTLECGEDLLRPPPPESLEDRTERIATMAASVVLLHLPNLGGTPPRVHDTAVGAVGTVAEAWRAWRNAYPSREEALQAIGPAIARQLPRFAAQLGPLAGEADVPSSLPPTAAERLATAIDDVVHGSERTDTEKLATSLRAHIRDLRLKEE